MDSSMMLTDPCQTRKMLGLGQPTEYVDCRSTNGLKEKVCRPPGLVTTKNGLLSLSVPVQVYTYGPQYWIQFELGYLLHQYRYYQRSLLSTILHPTLCWTTYPLGLTLVYKMIGVGKLQIFQKDLLGTKLGWKPLRMPWEEERITTNFIWKD